MNEPSDTAEYERLERQKAPAAAQYPGWFKRNFPPAALYTVLSVILGAAITVTWFIAASRADHVRADLFAQNRAEDHKLLEEEVGDIKAINSRLDVLQGLVIEHAKDNAYREGVVKGSTITSAEKRAAKQGK